MKKRFRVLPYYSYHEFFEGTNIIKRSFLSGEEFDAEEDEISEDQRFRLEECESLKKENVKKEKNSKKEKEHEPIITEQESKKINERRSAQELLRAGSFAATEEDENSEAESISDDETF